MLNGQTVKAIFEFWNRFQNSFINILIKLTPKVNALNGISSIFCTFHKLAVHFLVTNSKPFP